MFEHYSTGLSAAKESFVTHEPGLKNVKLEWPGTLTLKGILGAIQFLKRIRSTVTTRFKVAFINHESPGELHVFVADLPKDFWRGDKLYDSQSKSWRTILEIRKLSNCDLILKFEPDIELSEGEFWVEYPDQIAELLSTSWFWMYAMLNFRSQKCRVGQLKILEQFIDNLSFNLEILRLISGSRASESPEPSS